jgi:hypothetical protein
MRLDENHEGFLKNPGIRGLHSFTLAGTIILEPLCFPAPDA